jgi:vacuolar-type H+-ATPase subunit E/Vma4
VVVSAGIGGLDPVREALLAQAERDADRLVQQAADRAAAQVAEAKDETEAQIRRARAEGAAAAELEAAAELARAGRRARAHVLEAQRAVYDEVRRKAHEATRELRSTPGYADLVERLATRARAELGPEAKIERDPPAGGALARAGNRRLDYTLPVLVESALAEHAEDVEELWA